MQTAGDGAADAVDFQSKPALLPPRTAVGSTRPLMILFCLVVATSCSQPRRQPEDVDFGQIGQRRATSAEQPPHPQREQPTVEAATGATLGDATAAGGDGGGDGNGEGQSQDGSAGEAAGPAEAPSAGEGDGNGGQGGRGAGGSAGDAEGPGEGGPPAVPKAPAPALPGRESRRPAMGPDAAAKSATRLLAEAREAMRRNDRDSAAEAAIEAYDQVLPHADTDKACGKLCGELEKLLEANGRRRGPAAPVPTRFE